MKKDDTAYCLDLLENIEQIESYIQNSTLEQFLDSLLLQDALVRRITVVGEIAARLSSEARAQMKEIPWHAVIAMRNSVVHEYGHIDILAVWEASHNDIPLLKETVMKFLEK